MRFNLFRNPTALAGSPLSPKEAQKLILRGEAPADLQVRGHLNLSNNPTLETLPDGLTAASLDVIGLWSILERRIHGT
jgi:hypothetical protein